MDPAVEVGFRQRRLTGDMFRLSAHAAHISTHTYPWWRSVPGKMVSVLKGQSSFFIYCALPLFLFCLCRPSRSVSLSLSFLLNTHNVSEAAPIHGNVNI